MQNSASHPVSSNIRAREDPAPIAGVSLIDVDREAEALQRGGALAARGHSATTLIRTDDFRVVLIAINAGATVQEHQSSHGVALQTLRGRVQIHVSERVIDMPAGYLISLDRDVSHEVQAVEDSVVLVSIAWPEPRASDPVP